VAFEVDVLHAKGHGLAQAETRAVEKLSEEPERRLEPIEEGEHLAAREDRGEMGGASRAFETSERGRLDFEDLTVQEEERAERLILRGGRDAPTNGEVVEEVRHLRGSHLPRVAAVVEAHELARPVDVRFFRAG
jgi:hypothetical protein